MDWLNFHHLKYFYIMAREGGLRAAAEQLGVSQPSISSQIHLLEDALGAELFRKSGRNLVLTETGRLVFHYAEEIFELGGDMLRALKDQEHVQYLPFHVGLTNTIPKSVASEILKLVLTIPERLKIVCQEDDLEDQLNRLTTHRLDVVLTDEPAPSTLKMKVFNHFLGSTPVVLCAQPSIAASLQKDFPQSLDQAPMFLPSAHSPVRRNMDQWFKNQEIEPLVLGEFDDPALMMTLALEKEVCFPVPQFAYAKTKDHYGFVEVATLVDCRCDFYAITLERRLKHPAIQAVTQLAPQVLDSLVSPSSS